MDGKGRQEPVALRVENGALSGEACFVQDARKCERLLVRGPRG
jgi:hypothetical protein